MSKIINEHGLSIREQEDEEMDDLDLEDEEDWEDEEAELWIETYEGRIEIDSVDDYYGSISGAAEITGEGQTFLVVRDSSVAADLIRERWADMSAGELIGMIGEERIVDMWVNGTSFEDWVEEAIRYDAGGELAHYDGEERDIDAVSDALAEELGFMPEFAYRTN